jgi:hypothetical protein
MTVTTSAQELLVLRLKTLGSDVEKVRVAVAVAKGRDTQIIEVAQILSVSGPEGGVLGPLSELSQLALNLRDLMGNYDEIRQQIKEAEGSPSGATILARLDAAPEEFERIKGRLRDAKEKLVRIHTSMVDLGDRTQQLESSLSERCDVLVESIKKLEQTVATPGGDPRALWHAFDTMLNDKAQPLFREYVDFLGGLTVRDTGLDDRVCEMTEVLLKLFEGVVTHFFPIPAAQAALSSAMDSVIKLGFPEWSVWGIPLVVHEVGVALCNDKNEEGVQKLLDTWGGDDGPLTTAAVVELMGDAFASYTMGPAYGCAALLLRLQPQHDEEPGLEQARDVDRARLVLSILRSNAGDSDTDCAEVIRSLASLWRDAVKTLAGPGAESEAERDLAGPAPEEDWLDDFQHDVLGVLRNKLSIAAFGASQWAQVERRKKTLLGREDDPLLESPDDLLEVLNAVWTARLDSSAEPDLLAALVTELWERRRRASGAGRSGVGRRTV